MTTILASQARCHPAVCVPYGYNEGSPVGCDRIVATLAEAAELIAASQSQFS